MGSNPFSLSLRFQDQYVAKALMDLQDSSDSYCEEDQVYTTEVGTRIPNKSFYPVQTRSESIDVFQNTAVRELHKLEGRMKTNGRSNLTKTENVALKNLRANDNIIIRSADKGGHTVVLDKGPYIKLIDENTYRPLTLNSYQRCTTGIRTGFE